MFQHAMVSVSALALLAACAPPMAVEPPRRQVTVTPERPKVGESFTVKVQRLKSFNLGAEYPLDGKVAIQLQKVERQPEEPWGFWMPRPVVPKVATTTVEIGEVTVVNGVGEAAFELRSDYGSGIVAAPGEPIGVVAEGERWSSSSGFYVGGE
jgi:hypothetical protein